MARINFLRRWLGVGELQQGLDELAATVIQLKERIIMDMQKLQEELSTVQAGLQKVFGEVSAFKEAAAANQSSLQQAIADLEAQIANGGTVPEASVATLESIKSLLASTDALIEDLPAPAA